MSLPTAKDLIPKKNISLTSKLATVTQISNLRPLVTFDGEDTQSTKLYAYATGLTFSVGNRVFMQATDSTYFIACKITK